ncbi:Rhomboid family protein [Zostera marina]|uniref:Rhomboid family protein n=1 Tax=Zostera marina TaxID=29655 RepID=A0A0K9Q245_ZOSMR|nr:Rhomboid family protein [Zostera marina]
MRSNIVSEASLSTRFNQWWSGITFVTSGVIIVCSVIYLVCLLSGYDSFHEICFLPSEVISHFQVYRIFTAILFHGSLLHLFFNMLALVPLGAELERIMGSVRLLYLIILLATTNAILHILIALIVSHNPIHPFPYFMNECAIGFSGVLFSMIVIETSLSGVQSRSMFGLFNIPAKLYAWALLIAIQLLATNVSLLGHLCGILSGFAYTYGLFSYLLPGQSFYSSIESFPILSACLRRPGFILCTGGTPYGSIPTYSNTNTSSSGLFSQNLWRNISSFMPQRGTTADQVGQDLRFPGRGRTLSSNQSQSTPDVDSDSNLEVGLLENGLTEPHLTTPAIISDTRNISVGVPLVPTQSQELDSFDEELRKLVSMGFEKMQAEVALSAADGDPIIAIEILMSQQRT